MLFACPKDTKLLSSATYHWDPKVGTVITFGQGQTYSVCAILAMQFIYEGYCYMKDSMILYSNMMSLVSDNWIHGDVMFTVVLSVFLNLDSRSLFIFSHCSAR